MKQLIATKSGVAIDEGSIPFTRYPLASTTYLSSLSARLSRRRIKHRWVDVSGGWIALVDARDFNAVNAYKWRLHSRGYPVTSLKSRSGKFSSVLMHQFILGPAQPGFEWDHIKGNKLDNRRSQLRHVTHRQNTCNVGIGKNNTSGFKGVVAFRGKWRALITAMGRRIHLGVFALKEDAARAYDAASRVHHGHYGRLNFLDG